MRRPGRPGRRFRFSPGGSAVIDRGRETRKGRASPPGPSPKRSSPGPRPPDQNGETRPTEPSIWPIRLTSAPLVRVLRSMKSNTLPSLRP